MSNPSSKKENQDMLKKTAYDLAGIQIRPAIQNVETGEFIIYNTKGMSQPPETGWLVSLKRIFGIR
jgi:hypothetical protein